ncbi:MAG TPA: radical SAM protein [Candidatus Deferrimicrobium sp.]|nr:radical SAM protein [Candidatus Deferrimicrobium sp.]
MKVLRETISICPECKQQIKATVYEEEKQIYMKKSCPDHGEFEDILAHKKDYYLWRRQYHQDSREYSRAPEVCCDGGPQSQFGGKLGIKGCPYDCGICENHKSATCICLIDVTNRCNLKCPICFANANVTGYVVEPTMDELYEIMKYFRDTKPIPPGSCQLSGGEPTVREDLPDILKMAKKMGFTHRMVTTNGLKFLDIDFLKEVIDAGMNACYMQWDSVTDPGVYKKTRGVDLLQKKMQIIQNMRELKFKDCVLVPTIARGINDHQVAPILDFAVKNEDVVDCVVYQPVSLCGRITKEELMRLRYNASDLQEAISASGFIGKLYPVPTLSNFVKLVSWFEGVEAFELAAHEDCGFATFAQVSVDLNNPNNNKIHAIEEYIDPHKYLGMANRVWDFIKENKLENPRQLFAKLLSFTSVGTQLGEWLDGMAHRVFKKGMEFGYFAAAIPFLNPIGILKDLRGVMYLLRKLSKIVFNPNEENAANFLRDRGMFIACMHFQDAYNMDVERVSRCLVHYGYYDRELKKVFRVPFCTMNTIHRERIERKNAQYQDQKEIPIELITPEF